MIQIRYTRNLFLRAICVVYLFSFISFYIQIPGLYGDNGILPARSVLENNNYKTWATKVHYLPTLLWLAPFLGLDTQYALDVIALLGGFLAFTGFVSQKFCTIPLFAGIWSLYFSLYQIGQVFVTSQWDNLLLEAGFLCLLVAPVLPGRRRGPKITPTDTISFWLVRWLLFRFIFSAGIVKLLSGCPKWWGLSALSYYFESTILPTPLSWYVHQLPAWYLRIISVIVIVSEIFMPFLFFLPIRSIRITGYSLQLLLQIGAVQIGNFNFLNFLLVTLLLSLLDDQLFFGKSRSPPGRWPPIIGQVVNVCLHLAIIYGVVVLFNLRFTGSEITAKIGFNKSDFDGAMKQALLIGIYVGLSSLAFTIARSVLYALLETPGTVGKLLSLLGTAFYAGMATLIFISSTVPLSGLHPSTNSSILPSLRTLHNRLGKLHIINNYVAIEKVGSDQGRPEIILEGSDNIEGPWEEYQFLYKPGNVNHSLPFVAPYSPRIDWQMWWAAQSSYKEQPWLLSMVHRLLEGKPEVLALLDKNHSPFKNKPPKFIRGVLYNYKFTQWSQRWEPTWWKREKMTEYFPAFSKDSPALIDYLKARNLLPTTSKEKVHPIWKQVLDTIRYLSSHLEATLLLWSVFAAGCVIIQTTVRSK